MRSLLTPALGSRAEYVTLPHGGGHTFWDDAGKNGSVYDLAGPLLSEWIGRIS